MIRTLPLLILLFPLLAFAQNSLPVDKKTGHIIYSESINVSGASQYELHSRIMSFYNTSRATDNAMQIEQESASSITGKAFTDIILNNGNSTEKQRLWYTVRIELSDGSFSYELKDFSLQRYCIPARPIACEIQTKLVPVEAVYQPTKKSKKKAAQPYSIESEVNKAASSLVTALKSSATTDRQLAGFKATK